MPGGLFYLVFGRVYFLYKGCLISFYYYHVVLEISELITNVEDPDQTPRVAASEPGLHCLPMSLLWKARLKWVKIE